jgi:hypothetical protein
VEYAEFIIGPAKGRNVAKHLDRAALEKLRDPANYLGQAGEWWTGCWRRQER